MLTRTLIIAWIATLGGDRIDLLGGRGPATLLPFHVLTAGVVLLEGWRHLRSGQLPTVPPAAQRYVALLLGFVSLLLLSVLRSADLATSLGRATIVAATAVGMSVAAWAIADRPDLDRLLASGAKWGLGAAAVLGALQVAQLVGLVPKRVELGPAAVSLEAFTYGTIPRLSGLTLDMNRGGIVALVHAALLLVATRATRPPRGWLLLAAVLILGSLSRSTWLAAVPVVLYAPWRRWQLVPTRWGRALLLTGVAALVVAALALPRHLASAGRAVAPLGQRFDLDEGSAQAHAWLWERGVDIATRDVPTTLWGIGFGSSYRELYDFFAGSPYGNLHSGWLALWAESGVFAMLIAALLVLRRVPAAPELRGALLAVAIFNLFYVGTGDPGSWLVVAFSWLGVPSGGNA